MIAEELGNSNINAALNESVNWAHLPKVVSKCLSSAVPIWPFCSLSNTLNPSTKSPACDLSLFLATSCRIGRNSLKFILFSKIKQNHAMPSAARKSNHPLQTPQDIIRSWTMVWSNRSYYQSLYRTNRQTSSYPLASHGEGGYRIPLCIGVSAMYGVGIMVEICMKQFNRSRR